MNTYCKLYKLGTCTHTHIMAYKADSHTCNKLNMHKCTHSTLSHFFYSGVCMGIWSEFQSFSADEESDWQLSFFCFFAIPLSLHYSHHNTFLSVYLSVYLPVSLTPCLAIFLCVPPCIIYYCLPQCSLSVFNITPSCVCFFFGVKEFVHVIWVCIIVYMSLLLLGSDRWVYSTGCLGYLRKERLLWRI